MNLYGTVDGHLAQDGGRRLTVFCLLNPAFSLSKQFAEGLSFKVLEEHAAARFTSQATDFANAHRAEHLKQLRMPRTDQVHDAVNGQFPPDFLQGDGTVILLPA